MAEVDHTWNQEGRRRGGGVVRVGMGGCSRGEGGGLSLWLYQPAILGHQSQSSIVSIPLFSDLRLRRHRCLWVASSSASAAPPRYRTPPGDPRGLPACLCTHNVSCLLRCTCIISKLQKQEMLFFFFCSMSITYTTSVLFYCLSVSSHFAMCPR